MDRIIVIFMPIFIPRCRISTFDPLFFACS